MSRLMASRKRLLRVRDVQHNQAVVALSQAREEASHIASNARRLAEVREALYGEGGATFGGLLASRRELAGRLDHAGRQLDGALYDARRRVDERDAERVVADREREIAERLRDKAKAAREAQREARLAALPRFRRAQGRGSEE